MIESSGMYIPPFIKPSHRVLYVSCINCVAQAHDIYKKKLCNAFSRCNIKYPVCHLYFLSKRPFLNFKWLLGYAVLLYGCESWRMTEGDETKFDTFQHKCLRRLLKIYWPMRVSNEEVRRRTNTETIRELVRKRRWKLTGHVLRMDNSCLPRISLRTWTPEGKRKRGRLKETWRRTVENGPILHTERRKWWLWWWWLGYAMVDHAEVFNN